MTVEVPDGTTILTAAEKLGIHIPRYCFHPKLPIAGSCRMCLVEVEKAPKLQTACSTTVAEGMVVRTDTEQVKGAVRSVLELMLINHPIDCPICDQAGECGLQDYYMQFGLHKSRFALEDKVHKTKRQDIGGTIMLDSERCILCSRCVRFLKEVTKTGELDIFSRGDHSEISIFPGFPLDNHYTGNLADICPVGALTSKDFRFKCRVWFLSSTPSVCTGCSRGCNIEAHFKDDTLYRVKPRRNDAVNGDWMCDFGRVEYKKANENRLLSPVLREGGREDEAAWDAALAAVAGEIRSAVEKGGAGSVAFLLSPRSSNEELWLAARMAREVVGGATLAFTDRTTDGTFSDDLLIRADKNPNSRGARLLKVPEEFDALTKRISDGQVKVLVAFGNAMGDLAEGEVRALLSNVPFTAVVGTNASPLSAAAKAVLPGASFAERGGTFTNHDGRVQRFRAGFPPRGKARTDLSILLALADRLGAGWSYRDEAHVFEAMAASEAPFAGMSYETLGDLGQEAKG
jgi:NADH-quinone oxidoreductase subunit G